MTAARRIALAIVAAGALVAGPATAESASAAPVPGGPSPSGLFMTSDQGDYIGQGRSYSYPDQSLPDLRFTATPTAVSYRFFENGDWWNVDVSAPASQPLAEGFSFPVQRNSFRTAGSGGLDVNGEGRGCNTLTGYVTVNQYEFYQSGASTFLKNLDVSFVQHCEGSGPALNGRVVWHVGDGHGVHPAANIEGPAKRTTTYGSTVSLSGYAPTAHPVAVWFHRACTTGYSQRRSALPASSGGWNTRYVANDDYRIYVSSAGEPSSSVLVQISPAIAGPARVITRRHTTYTITGTAIPGAALTLHFHRAGTTSSDYSMIRTVTVGESGHWSAPYLADTDYRFFASLHNGQRSTPVLVQAR